MKEKAAGLCSGEATEEATKHWDERNRSAIFALGIPAQFCILMTDTAASHALAPHPSRCVFLFLSCLFFSFTIPPCFLPNSGGLSSLPPISPLLSFLLDINNANTECGCLKMNLVCVCSWRGEESEGESERDREREKEGEKAQATENSFRKSFN